MPVAAKFGLIVGALLGVSQLVAPGPWGVVVLLGAIAVVSLAHAVIGWSRAGLVWFSYGLIVNGLSAVLLALTLTLLDVLAVPWLVGLGTAALVGLLSSAWLTRLQGRATPAVWLEFKRELEDSSVVDLVLARPLTALTSRS